MKTGPSQTDESLVRLILQYWIEHPDAKDTRRGIHKWWLPERHSHRGGNEVQMALDVLAARGWLTKRGTIPSKEIYGISKDRITEIKSFLLSGTNF